MSKYHVNPDTGKPGVCSAKTKCRFGLSDDSHFDSKESAGKFYEDQMSEQQIVSTSKNSRFLKDPEKMKEITKLSESLILGLLNSEGDFEKPSQTSDDSWKYDPEREEYVVVKAKSMNPNGFEFLNSGIDRNVYVDPQKRYVLKVRNDYTLGENGYDKGSEIEEMAFKDLEEKAYNRIDRVSLAKQDCEYAETAFIVCEDKNGHKIPVTVQPYLNPEDFENCRLSPEEKYFLSEDTALKDLHHGNIMVNKKTGRKVLFDCLNINLKPDAKQLSAEELVAGTNWD